jgi:hypothetical protein|tara:strand:+ start:773 stop:1036 length:264 start_codon:yes stop_codon:yes gene_type:complete
MKLNESQLDTLRSDYCTMIIDDMDMDSLLGCMFDMMMKEYSTCGQDELIGEILNLYDQEVLDSLLPKQEVISELEVNTPQMGMGVGK